MFGRWGEGVGGGEFPLPQAYFSNFRVTRYFCPIILLHSSLFSVSFALLFILFPLHFDLFIAFVVVVVPLFHFLFLPFCCQFQRIFANFSPGAEGGGDFFGLRGEERGGGEIRLITSHTERTKFFIARKKAASFRDTLVLQKTLGS